MRVRVRLFAVLRERAGAGELALELPAGATVGDAVAALAGCHPALGALRGVAYAVNQSYAAADAALNDGDELALIPSVSGG